MQVVASIDYGDIIGIGLVLLWLFILHYKRIKRLLGLTPKSGQYQVTVRVNEGT